MARIQKEGVDYFPIDVDILQNKKVRLLVAEFGNDGVALLLYLLCEIYKNGYYKKWDEEDALFATAFVGNCTAEKINTIVKACVKRGVFNARLFRRYSVLTSAQVQRRYLRAVSSREEIRIRKEYFLLDVTSKQDVPVFVRGKLRFYTLPRRKNATESTLEQTSIESLFAIPESEEKK